jgi:protein TonB
MTPRMFEDLVVSCAARPGRGRGRAVPLSLAVHGAVFAAIAAVPLLREPALVEAAQPRWTDVLLPMPPTAVVVQPPAPPVRVEPRRAAAPAPARDVRPVAPGTSATTPAPALPSDLSLLGTGDPTADSPELCLHDCTPGAPLVGTAPIGVDTGGHVPGDPTPRRAGVDVTPPLRIGGAQPVYPELGKAVRTGARVVIECTIDPRGRVVNAVITRGHPLFDAAALDAVRTWQYRPTLIDGVPVPVLMTVTVNFTLR